MKHIIRRKYTLFHRGELVLNWDDLPYLQHALGTLKNTHGTYIRYNETGKEEYQAKRAA